MRRWLLMLGPLAALVLALAVVLPAGASVMFDLDDPVYQVGGSQVAFGLGVPHDLASLPGVGGSLDVYVPRGVDTAKLADSGLFTVRARVHQVAWLPRGDGWAVGYAVARVDAPGTGPALFEVTVGGQQPQQVQGRLHQPMVQWFTVQTGGDSHAGPGRSR